MLTVWAHQAEGETANKPVNIVAPALSPPGLTGYVGDTFTCDNGTFSGPNLTYTYQWLRQGLPINGETTNQYTAQNGDVASSIQCDVTAQNSFGKATARSNIKLVQQPLAAPVNTSPPIASGAAVVGGTADCGNGIWTGNPDPTFTYQWQRDQVDIPGATNSEYPPVADDVGHKLRVGVTAHNSQGDTGPVYSNEIGPVTA